MSANRICCSALMLLLAASCAHATSQSRDEELGMGASPAEGGGSGGLPRGKAGSGGQMPIGSGGALSSKGGSAGAGGSAGGGTLANAGGSLPRGGAGPGGCVIGEVKDCADVQPQFPKGTTTCGRDGFPTTTCRTCDGGDSVDCSALPQNDAAPFGQASCDPAAGFGKGDFRREECQICEPGITHIDCLKIPGGAYTGGQAVCNPSGDGWLDATCAVCGDGAKNGALEQCDGADVTATTCGALDFGGTDPATPVVSCAVNCNYDSSDCGHCAGGVAAGDCLESGSCTGTACDGKGCARDGSCQFQCRDSASNKCRYPVCSERATCRFDCYNQGGCLSPQCRAGASCQFGCQNKLAQCLDIACEDGAKCDFNCSDGGTCTTSHEVLCKTGDECMLDCSHAGNCAEFVMTCQAGSICHLHMDDAATTPKVTCEAGATCHLHCSGADCSSIECAGSGCKCDGGTCPGFH
jgi:hypothetical protein